MEKTLLHERDYVKKSPLVIYMNTRTNEEHCACLACRKTFSTKTSRLTQTKAACPDCGAEAAKSIWDMYDDNIFEVKKSRKARDSKIDTRHYVQPNKQKTYVQKNANGDVSKMECMTEMDLFTIYPSNRMHVSPITLSTFYDFDKQSISFAMVNHDIPDQPALMYASELKDAFTYSHRDFRPKRTPLTLSACVGASGVGFRASHKDKLENELGVEIFSDFITFSQDDLMFDKFNTIGKYGVNDAYQLACEKYHLTETLENIMNGFSPVDKMFTFVNMAVRYPAVVDWQISKMDENYKYAKPPVPLDEQLAQKKASLYTLAHQMATVDDKILKDLKTQKTGKNVESYLQYLTFGKNADNTTDVNHVIGHIAVDGAKNEGFGTLKSLRKNYNKNPLGIANIIYTAGTKIGFRDINHINQFVELADREVPILNSAFYNRTMAPLHTRASIQFLKQYAKSHSPSQLISDVYGVTTNPYGKEEAKIDYSAVVRDAVLLFDNCQKVGKICATKQETDEAMLYDTKKKISSMIKDENLSEDDIVTRFRPRWGKDAEVCTKLLLRDLSENGELEDKLYFYGRDGKPIFTNRTVNEIHNELSAKQGTVEKLAHGNREIPHTDEDRVRFNREIGDYKFQLSPNTYDLIRTGEQMQICVGGYGDMATSGHCHIVTMSNSNHEKVACIELDSMKQNLLQFKAFRNTGIPVECVDAAKQWLRDADINPDRCRDYTEGFGHPDYAPYGNQDFTAVRFPANPLPPANFILKMYNRGLPEVASEVDFRSQGVGGVVPPQEDEHDWFE